MFCHLRDSCTVKVTVLCLYMATLSPSGLVHHTNGAVCTIFKIYVVFRLKMQHKHIVCWVAGCVLNKLLLLVWVRLLLLMCGFLLFFLEYTKARLYTCASSSSIQGPCNLWRACAWITIHSWLCLFMWGPRLYTSGFEVYPSGVISWWENHDLVSLSCWLEYLLHCNGDVLLILPFTCFVGESIEKKFESYLHGLCDAGARLLTALMCEGYYCRSVCLCVRP